MGMRFSRRTLSARGCLFEARRVERNNRFYRFMQAVSVYPHQPESGLAVEEVITETFPQW